MAIKKVTVGTHQKLRKIPAGKAEAIDKISRKISKIQEKPETGDRPVKGTVIGVKRSRRILGIPPKRKISNAKPIVTIRLDPEILDHFKGHGPGWQTRINEALVRYVRRAKGG